MDAPRDGFVTDYEVHPGNSQIVHHVIAYAPQDDGFQLITLDETEEWG